MKNLFTSLLLFIAIYSVAQDKGTLQGKVLDKEAGNEPLPFANVFVKGTQSGTTTGMDGVYLFTANPGTYTLVVSFVGYETIEIPNVIVKAGEVTTLENIVLGPNQGVALKEVVVKATTQKESVAALLTEQKKAVEIKTAIGAEELSVKGVSDAEGAVTKISGVSKQEGVKNVFVRGLGDRYNASSLNGFPIPSEDPEYKNISLDFFGTDIIKNIGISKVFSSKSIGDVGGANIDISSKELSGNSTFSIDISGGVNTQVVSNDFFEQDGVDFFGFSNSEEPKTTASFAFDNSLDPSKVGTPFNNGFGLSGGKRFLFENDNSLSFFVIGSHSTDYSFTEQTIRNTTTTGQIFLNQKGTKYSKNISQIGLANAIYKIKNKHKLMYNFMLIHNNNQYVGEYFGEDSEKYQDAYNDSYLGYMIRQQNNDNTLMVNQFITEWKLSDFTDFNAGASYNTVKGLEPDRRINNFSKISDTEYHLTGSTGNQVRTYLTLKEQDFNTKLSLSHKLKKTDEEDLVSKVQVGYNGRYVFDDFDAIEYDFTKAPGNVDVNNLFLDGFYSDANFNNSNFSIDRNFDGYTVDKFINSGYADLTYQINPDFVANLGVSADKVDLVVDYIVNRGSTKGSSKINELYILPSLNLKYNLSEKNSLRLGLSKTYTLPQSKEISPYIYISPSYRSQGNPNLQPSENYNFDIKWDYYLSSTEIFSLTGFYKNIKDPISRVEEGGSGGYLTYKNVSDHANVLGLELELRKNLLKSAEDSEDRNYTLSTGINASYIYSQLKVDVLNTPKKTSELEGSAPLLANFDITYNSSINDKKFVSSLVLNYFSDRIFTIGTLSYQDIIEKGVVGLDFVSSLGINKNLTLKFKAKNILDPTYQLSRKGNTNNKNIILNSYKKGVNLGLGLSYKF